MVGAMSIVLNQHQELCELHNNGGVPVEPAFLMRCVHTAASVAPRHLLLLEKVLHSRANPHPHPHPHHPHPCHQTCVKTVDIQRVYQESPTVMALLAWLGEATP